jgi:hypothetical protein
LERLEQLEQLERLEQLEQLERLERLERLQIYSLSYDEIDIQPGSVIYCDPPYVSKEKYQTEFNHDKFYKWCLGSKNPIFISEYWMPIPFKKIASFKHRCTLGATANNEVIENLFWNGVKFNEKTLI